MGTRSHERPAVSGAAECCCGGLSASDRLTTLLSVTSGAAFAPSSAARRRGSVNRSPARRDGDRTGYAGRLGGQPTRGRGSGYYDSCVDPEIGAGAGRSSARINRPWRPVALSQLRQRRWLGRPPPGRGGAGAEHSGRGLSTPRAPLASSSGPRDFRWLSPVMVYGVVVGRGMAAPERRL